MNECSVCDKGVHPFYEVETHKGKQSICHTCFHTGKHKQVVAHPAVQASTVPDIQREAPKSSKQAR